MDDEDALAGSKEWIDKRAFGAMANAKGWLEKLDFVWNQAADGFPGLLSLILEHDSPEVYAQFVAGDESLAATIARLEKNLARAQQTLREFRREVSRRAIEAQRMPRE